MQVETISFGDWAQDAYHALHDDIHASSDKWLDFGSSSPTVPQSAFTIPPSLLAQKSVERYGQLTPPEDLSPAEPVVEPRRDSAREGSIPVEQLKNEALFPEHQLQALQDYQPHHASQSQEAAEPSPKRRRTGRQAPAKAVDPTSSQPEQATANPQPAKRKRGRPKSQPTMVEAYSAEGYPFQVSSARQSHLEKNRVAAHKCRQRKKEYINGLEGRAREFSQTNKVLKENVAMLREEVLGLKNEVLRHAGCGFWAVDEYLARCAGDLLGVDAPGEVSNSAARKPIQQQATSLTPTDEEKMHRESSAESLPSYGTFDSPDQDDEFGGLDLLEDLEQDDDELAV